MQIKCSTWSKYPKVVGVRSNVCRLICCCRYNGAMFRRIFATMLFLLGVAPAWAGGGQDLVRLQLEAQRFVDQQSASGRGPMRDVSPPDARLFLPACPDLSIAWPAGVPAESVAVRCPVLGWSIALPLKARGVASVYVAASLIGAGQTVGIGDIRLAAVANPALARQGVSDSSQLVGRAARTQIPPGAVIRVTALRAPFVVRMRQPVRAMVSQDGLRVSAEGVANNNAAVGEPVRVRMPGGRVVSGIADADGSVRVEMQ
ncbi:flagellar basal body P-ring formation protein FlgA [Neisseriaceae bacterium B2N2-7]|uniref:Flagellar basal body P-ring formation protein FlgA n=2 Tax=Craterilacuibacter sinensis TaxID=2686017 RepID=A0A845C0T2_9NEIS|nr:flagellar basal body P-ring formation protein FlgA [Craterilacuibacter sinensis]